MILLALAVISAVGLRIFLRVAPGFDLVDHPNARSLHSAPTVVSGGAVPMLLLALSMAMTLELPGYQDHTSERTRDPAMTHQLDSL